MDSSQRSLRSAETKLLTFFLVLFLCLFLLAKIQSYQIGAALRKLEAHKRLAVRIEGAVKKPGTYWVAPGTKWEEIFRKAKLKPTADVEALMLSERVEEAGCLTVPERTSLTIFVKGAVQQEMAIEVPVDTRICDLKTYGLMADGADKAFFKRRRRLKDKEILEIPWIHEKKEGFE